MTARATQSLEKAKEQVTAPSRAPIWALAFESIVRGITGVVVLLLIVILGTISLHGAPRVVGVETKPPEVLVRDAVVGSDASGATITADVVATADAGRFQFSWYGDAPDEGRLPEGGITSVDFGPLQLQAQRQQLVAILDGTEERIGRGQHLVFSEGTLKRFEYSIYTFNLNFLTQPPRDGMESGGIFPALFGTAFVVLFMITMALPLGVFGAVYLVEYTKGGITSRLIRAAVNNLAGVPSIVFGLFGLGFFVLFVGRNFDYHLYGVPRNEREQQALEARLEPLREAARAEAIKLATEQGIRGPERAAFIRDHVAKTTPPTPRRFLGQGAMFWASATLAILVLPVIIVATEESLRAVPASLREAAYGLGATKWQVISTVVLPQARAGILTGAILAVARGAGELAPILFVGVTFFAPTLPLTEPINFYFFEMPVVNPFQQFMYLNYHIYTMATQHPNPEGTRAIQFASTLVLVALTLLMNMAAILLRRRLSRPTR